MFQHPFLKQRALRNHIITAAIELIGTPQTYVVSISASYTFAVTDVQVGDQVLIAAGCRMNSGSATTFSFSNDQGTTARTPGGYVDGGVALQSAVMTVATAGTINCTVAPAGASAVYIVVYLYRGGTLMPDTGNEHGATMARAAGETPFALGPCNVSSRGLGLVFAYSGTFSVGIDAPMQLNNGSAFTLDAETTFVNTRHIDIWRTMTNSGFSQSNLSVQTTTTADATILYNWAPYTY